MSSFPVSEAETFALCQMIINGIEAHPASFPSLTVAMKDAMVAARDMYTATKGEQEVARTEAKTATTQKNTAFDELTDQMKTALKLAEIDCAANPDALGYIGWGEHLESSSAELPAQPVSLRITAEGPDDIWLDWAHPTRQSIRHWLVERRRQLTPGGDYSAWELAGTSLTTELHLTGQPSGAKLEYRVKAENTLGVSEPSNSVFAVL